MKAVLTVRHIVQYKISERMFIMQAIVETLFDTVYLFSVITIGILMIRKSKGNRQFTMFGIMAVILGCGDAFHLVPRATALCTTGLENFTVQLGLGKWITSITMTIFMSFSIIYGVSAIRLKAIKQLQQLFMFLQD